MEFKKHLQVKIDDFNNYKVVTSLRNGSTPGIKCDFKVIPNANYTIKFTGYKKCKGNVILWIGHKRKTILYDKKYCLDSANKTILYNFKNTNLKSITVGLLFHKPQIRDRFFISSITIEKKVDKFFVPLTALEKKKIDQFIISTTIKTFETSFKKKFSMINYYSHNEPAIFFGMYNDTDFDNLKNHKSLAVIVWGGNDIIKLVKKKSEVYKYIKSNPNIKNVAISSFIENDLLSLDLNPYRINFSLADTDTFKPVIKGNSIYVYCDKAKTEKYSYSKIKLLCKRLPKFNFIISHCKTFKQKEMPSVYSRCFIGLRLTKHDGNANTTQELGLCGIKCVHNGDMPNCIKWSNTDDIIKAIRQEAKSIGTMDIELANEVKEVLTSNNEWLNINYYD